ncbi:MAG: MmgE/PrpD family protein [Desulfobacteraceae bacterium]|nr:MmgE/PrpD family protein [Desulfobacteraceae bacterium]
MAFSSPTDEISRLIVEASFDDFPAEVVDAAKLSLLDWTAVTLGGTHEPSTKILIDLIKELGGERQASILGRGIATTTLHAALVNGTMAHTLDYDDAHSETRNHTSAPLVPALLAIAEQKEMSGQDLITAYIVGFEVSTRIGLALGKRYYENGWHATSILGRFGAAAGAAKLLGLNTRQVKNALGIAATQTGGIRGVFGTMSKPFHAGKAAMDGMLSAMLAQRDFSGPKGILDDNSDYVRLFSEEYDSVHLSKKPGRNYHVLGNSLKLHAACLLLHPIIDGLLAIKTEFDFKPETIQRIKLEVAPLCLTVTDKPSIVDGAEGKFSLHFCAALAVMRGKVGSNEFTETMVNDPGIRNLMQKIEVKCNASLKETEADVVVYLAKDRRLAKHVSAPRGDPRKPLTFAEIEEKFKDLNRQVISEERIGEIAAAVATVEKMSNIAILVRLCCFGVVDTMSR